MSDLFAKKNRCCALKMTKLDPLQVHEQVFSRKVFSTDSVANTLHFLPLHRKIALTPPIFELEL